MSNQEKSLLRKQYLITRQSIDPRQRQAWTKAATDLLFALPCWQEAKLVYGYISVRGEPDTAPILRRAIEEGKDVALPCTLTGADQGRMIFRRLPRDPHYALSEKRFGIPEPNEDCPEIRLDTEANGLMLLPGLAFDLQGYRVGYGGGYYDRFLQQAARAGVSLTTVGITFSLLIENTLPHGDHDIPAHIIIDERRVRYAHGQV